MCGIVAIVGQQEVAERLFEGLRRLEYRGYDSAGICTLVGGAFERRRAEGKLDNLGARLAEKALPGITGIGPKSAKQLLTEFHTLEGIYQQLDQVPARWREKLAEGRQMAEISRQVATLKRDLVLQGNLNTLRYTG